MLANIRFACVACLRKCHTVIDLNKTHANHVYPAMTRPPVIDSFMDKVINHLRTQPNRVNVGYLFYYSYDSAGKSDMCDATAFNTGRRIKGTCFNGVIDPITGDLLPDVVAALMNHRWEARPRRRVSEFGAFHVKRASALKANQVRPVHAACVSRPSCRESRAGSKLSQLPERGAGI
jgi:hypothetical protein